MIQRASTLLFYSDVAKEADGYVEDNYNDPDLSFGNFVDEFHLSKRSVQRALAYHGMSWRGIVQYHRMKAAKEELLSSDNTVAEIARKVGYRQASHMTKIFKGVTGDTPAEYRRKHKLVPSSLKAA